jgi:hypothetical protein
MNACTCRVFSDSAVWQSIRSALTLAEDEAILKLWELSLVDLRAYLARRKAALEALVPLAQAATPADLVPMFRERLLNDFIVDARRVCDARVGYVCLRAQEEDALQAASAQLIELLRVESRLQADDGCRRCLAG